MSGADKILSKPEPIKLPQTHVRLRHYGHLVEQLLEKLQTMPEGEERNELVKVTANQMKRDLVQWGHGSMDDERVANDLARYTNGVIQLDLSNFKFDKVVLDDSKKTKKKK